MTILFICTYLYRRFFKSKAVMQENAGDIF